MFSLFLQYPAQQTSRKVAWQLYFFPFFDQLKDAIISGIERRLADWTFLLEAMLCYLFFPLVQGLRALASLFLDLKRSSMFRFCIILWSWSEVWSPLWFFPWQETLKRGGHRVATVLMYLRDVKMGGVTDSKCWDMPLFLRLLGLYCTTT